MLKEDTHWADAFLREWGQWWRKAHWVRPKLGYGRSTMALCLDSMAGLRCQMCLGSGKGGKVKIEGVWEICPVCKGMAIMRADYSKGDQINPAMIRATYIADDMDSEPVIYQELDELIKNRPFKERIVVQSHYVIFPDGPEKARMRVVIRKLRDSGEKPFKTRTYYNHLFSAREAVIQNHADQINVLSNFSRHK